MAGARGRKYSQVILTVSRSAQLGGTVATVGFPDIGLQGLPLLSIEQPFVQHESWSLDSAQLLFECVLIFVLHLR